MHTRTLTRTSRRETGQSLADSLALAAVVIGRVLDGESLTLAMSSLRVSGPRRAAVQDLAYSALRDYGRIQALVALLVSRPPVASLRGLLMAALVELQYGPQAAHAVVHQAVEAAARIAPRGGAAAKGLVNAVLRRFLRERAALLEQSSGTEEGRYRHPQWWIDLVRSAWPESWEAVLASGNQVPGMMLRVNARRSDGLAYLHRLKAAGIEGSLWGSHAVRLTKPVAVERLPGFSEGDCSVQDWGAQQAAPLLEVEPGMRVLDACASPGGKAAHIAEIVDCDLTAADVDRNRLERLTGNFLRLNLRARVIEGDALLPRNTEDGRYHRILADVPCSASGVVRRHPDIKWLRRESDLDVFAATQRAMLESLWEQLLPAGRLLYVTCSVFPQENNLQIEVFRASHPDACPRPLSRLSPELAGSRLPGQILPSDRSDGFFYALLEKRC